MKIVVLDGITLNPGDNPWTPIEALGTVEVFDQTTAEETLHRCEGAEVIATNKVVIDRAVIDGLPDLKMIAVTATGFNVVDVAYAHARGIIVSNVPVYGTDSVAQHVFAMLLAFYNRVEAHHDAIQQGQWQQRGQFSFWLSPIDELVGKKFGVVGFGRIGQATARLAKAFGMEIVIHSRTERTVDGFESAQWMTIDELFETADVISLHCPQTESNVGFVNQTLLRLMQPTAVLVNTARGGLIDEQALTNALNEGSIGGACLDVLSSEPPASDNPLLSADRCLLTPHIAWTAVQARKRLMQVTADNIAAYVAGKPQNVVSVRNGIGEMAKDF